jgi:UDP-N-acetylglucosamine diphosphorylase/glucosamine-1-phosphate N-acetyltransferase
MTSSASAPALVVFDDGRGCFGPLTDLRAAYDLRAGIMTNRQRIERVFGRKAVGLLASAELSPLAEPADCADVDEPDDVDEPTAPFAGDALLVNGRWLADDAALVRTIAALPRGRALVSRDDPRQLVAVHADASVVAELVDTHFSASGGPTLRIQSTPIEATLAARPWHLLHGLEQRLTRDIAQLDLKPMDPLPQSVTRVGPHAVLAASDAMIGPHVHLDTTLGPIAFAAGCVVYPFTMIEGPAFIGPEAVVAATTTLRSGCVIGRACKVGGEVKASILDDFTNKAHFGYLGNAVVGRWCNLGAGTTASNLKNTWGPVRMQLTPDADSEDTGRTFLGPVLGDFVRTAIGTALPTGAVVGTAACLVTASFPSKYVPAMTFLTDAGPAPTDLDALRRTLTAMMQRRGQRPTDTLLQRLQDLSEARDH